MSLPSPAHAPHWLDLDGVVNMRDVGGLPLRDGGTTASGRLIRSDNLQSLPPASVRHLVDDLGVSTVVDLRTHVEVAKEGDGPMLAEDGVRVVHLTLYVEDSPETGIPAAERDLPWRKEARVGDAAQVGVSAGTGGRPETDSAEAEREEEAEGGDEPGRHNRFWAKHYLSYLEQRPDHVVAALRTIADAPGAVIVHCAAGKDRTGTVVGLALVLAGVEQDAVVADFEASAERVPRILARLSGQPAYRMNLEGKTVRQQSPRADTMRLLLATLDQEYGGAEAWLTRQGWTADDTRRLRAKLRD